MFIEIYTIFYNELPSRQLEIFECGLVVHYDEQLFLTSIPSITNNYNFSRLWSELDNEYKAISSDLYGYKWPEDECLTKDECDKLRPPPKKESKYRGTSFKFYKCN